MMELLRKIDLYDYVNDPDYFCFILERLKRYCLGEVEIDKDEMWQLLCILETVFNKVDRSEEFVKVQ